MVRIGTWQGCNVYRGITKGINADGGKIQDDEKIQCCKFTCLFLFRLTCRILQTPQQCVSHPSIDVQAYTSFLSTAQRMKSLVLFGLVITCLIFVQWERVYAQTPTIDSLEKELRRGGKSDSARLYLFLHLSYHLNNLNPVRSEEYARSAIELSQKLRFRKELARAYRYTGVSLQMRTFYLQALRYYDSSRSIAESIDDKEAISAVWTNMGLLYESQGDYPRALDYALRALRIDEDLKKKDVIANSLSNIGTLYYHQKEYTTALHYYERSKGFINAATDPELVSEICYGIGRIYKDRTNFDQALRSFDTALVIARINSNDRLIGIITLDIGSTHLLRGEIASAREYLQEALSVQQKRQDKAGIAEAMAVFGRYYLLRAELPKAEEYCMASLRLADELGLKETQMEVCRYLAELYKQQGQLKKALEYKERELACRDSLVSAERSKEIGRLEMRYQLEQKDTENQLLLRDRALREANESRSQLLLIALSVVLLLSLGITLVLWQFGNKQRHINAELQRHQNLVEEQARKIEMVNTELQERNILLLDANKELQSAYTQIHHQSKSLQEQNLALEQLGNEKNEIVAIVAHDLKNPIIAIRGLSELMDEELAGGEQAKELNAQISQTAERMLGLVKNVLDMNRLESGAIQMKIVAFDVKPLAENVLSTFTEQAAAKAITLHFQDALHNILVLADEQAVMQVIENLISNALKYSPYGKKVFVCLKAVDAYVRIEVRDEGPGISQDDMKKLFGKFVRLSARPTGGEHSTGLGLSIVKKMVEAMNGRVWCESEVGKGATFVVELPAVV